MAYVQLMHDRHIYKPTVSLQKIYKISLHINDYQMYTHNPTQLNRFSAFKKTSKVLYNYECF